MVRRGMMALRFIRRRPCSSLPHSPVSAHSSASSSSVTERHKAGGKGFSSEPYHALTAMWGLIMAHPNKSVKRATVLIVDDERPIRMMIAQVLSNVHYETYQAPDAIEAAYQIHRLDGNIDLLITDVMMPLVTGPELGAWVRTVWPHIPILFLSAFVEPSRFRLSTEDLAHHFLSKPFPLSELVRRVDSMTNTAEHIDRTGVETHGSTLTGKK